MAEINIIKSTQELAQMMKSNPSFIEKEELSIGQELLSLFQDNNFTDGFQNLKTLKQEVLRQVIEDISMGGHKLKENSFGVTFKAGKLSTFTSPLGITAEGNVVFSITQKSKAAFKNWRNQDDDELSQDAINSAIYFLAATWSHLL